MGTVKMEDMHLKIKEIAETNSTMSDDLRSLRGSIHELSISIERQTNVLDTYKAIMAMQIDNILNVQKEIKEMSLNNQKKINELEKEVSKAKGATGMAQVLWGVIWSVGSAIVTAVVFVMKGGGGQ